MLNDAYFMKLACNGGQKIAINKISQHSHTHLDIHLFVEKLNSMKSSLLGFVAWIFKVEHVSFRFVNGLVLNLIYYYFTCIIHTSGLFINIEIDVNSIVLRHGACLTHPGEAVRVAPKNLLIMMLDICSRRRGSCTKKLTHLCVWNMFCQLIKYAQSFVVSFFPLCWFGSSTCCGIWMSMWMEGKGLAPDAVTELMVKL